MVLCTYRRQPRRRWSRPSRGDGRGKAKNAFLIVVLGLFRHGRVHDERRLTWGDGWIRPETGDEVRSSSAGPARRGTGADELKKALMRKWPGPLGETPRRLARDPRLWIVTLANPAIVFAIAWT